MKNQRQKNKIILTVLSILFILLFFKTFLNVYVIQRNDYSTRLTNNYGYCDKQGYGFVNSTLNKNKIKNNVRIINNYKSLGAIDALFYNFNEVYNENYLILLNYKNNNSSIIFNNVKYEILDNYNNQCFLVKKND
jgi:hypothetical protein